MARYVGPCAARPAFPMRTLRGGLWGAACPAAGAGALPPAGAGGALAAPGLGAAAVGGAAVAGALVAGAAGAASRAVGVVQPSSTPASISVRRPGNRRHMGNLLARAW